MALFGLGKKSGIQVQPKGPASGIPVDIVLQMRQQGISNNQIIQSLQREGYSSQQIFDAMTQADIKGIVTGPEEPINAEPENSMQAGQMGVQEMPQMQEMQPEPSYGYPQQMPLPMRSSGMTKEEIEELIEAIVEEKWDELVKAVDKIVAWKEATEENLLKLENRINSLKDSFDKLHAGVLGKITEYDKGIRDVGVEIKAMDEVFKKILPTFTENVSELSRVTKRIKEKK